MYQDLYHSSATYAYVHFKDCHALLLMFSLDNRRTMEEALRFVEKAREMIPNFPLVLWIGNKSDKLREVATEEGIEIAKKQGFVEYVETSCKTGQNCSYVFDRIAELCIKKIQEEENEELEKSKNKKCVLC